jgi:hypothetical protein
MPIRSLIVATVVIVFTISFIAPVAPARISALEIPASAEDEVTTLAVDGYGIEVVVPVTWKLVAKSEDSMIFGFSIPNDDPKLDAGIKCEIANAPESLDEYRTRIDRRAEREQKRVPGLSLRSNEIRKRDDTDWLLSHWAFEPAGRSAMHDLELRLVANQQLYLFTLRTPDAQLETLRPQLERLVAAAKFTPPETGLELTKEGYCVQKKFRFGLKLPEGWRPAFPLSAESLFWATAKPHGIWNDNLLVIASKAQPLDLEALAETVPDQLRREDPNCTVKSCQRVTQGKIGDALETVVETQRGTFKITVLERRYTGRRYNYEIKFTVESETFEKSADALRKSADTFVEFVEPQDGKSGAT